MVARIPPMQRIAKPNLRSRTDAPKRKPTHPQKRGSTKAHARKSGKTRIRLSAFEESRRCGFFQKNKMNTIDCSPIGRNELSFWILGKSRMTMLKPSLPDALRKIRKARGLSQEAFSDVSSRTYLSSLERDLKSPTLNKLAELCEVMEVHPLTLLTLAYAGAGQLEISQLLDKVKNELNAIVANKEDKRNDD